MGDEDPFICIVTEERKKKEHLKQRVKLLCNERLISLLQIHCSKLTEELQK